MSNLRGKSSNSISLRLSFSCLWLYLNGLVLGLVLPISVHAQTEEAATLLEQSVEHSVEQSELQKQVDKEKLRHSIDVQFVELRKDLEQENAFSLELADGYFEYATLLSEAGYYEDANSAYEKANHIQKTNHGIDSEQQIPALEALFNNYFLSGEIDEAQTYIENVVRIEEKNPSIKDKPSTIMQLKLGHYYLDKLKNSSPDSEIAVTYLKLANKYFLAVVQQNREKKLSGTLFPYGELAMTSYLGDQLVRKPEKIYKSSFQLSSANLLREVRGHSQAVMSTESAPVEDIQHNVEIDQALPRALSMLKYYFNKADEEGNVKEALKATLALGGLNYLAGRVQLAKDYYAMAWAVAKLLPENHPDRLALKQPAQLPDFKYAYNPVVNQDEIDNADDGDQILTVPLQFDVNERGSIKNVKVLVDAERKLVSKAKRELRKYPFRPAIREGLLTDAEGFVQLVAVNVN